MKDLVVAEQLPLIPENWDYEESVAKAKQLVSTWKQITFEMVTELYIAREKLRDWGGDHKSKKYHLNKNLVDLNWSTYCKSVGLNQIVANRWIASVFGKSFLPSPPLPRLESQVLYADPPWAFDNSGFDQSASQQYSTLSVEDICKYSDGEKTIRQLANERRSVLFLWVPEALLPEGLEVTKAWGFLYKAQLVWQKDRSPGMGWWVKAKHELLFLASKGEELHPAVKYDSVFQAPVTNHSKKPELVYEMIEAMYTGPYIELFARNTRPNWESWGNELT